MRYLPPQDLVRFESGYSNVEIHLVVDQQDLTDLEGKSWVRSVEWGESLDALTPDLKVRLVLREGAISLSPFVSSSKLNQVRNVIDINREVELTAALVSECGVATSIELKTYFKGKIDDIKLDEASNTLSFTARGLAGELSDIQLETGRTHTGDAEDVMQDIIDDGWEDAYGTTPTPPTLQTPNGSPGFTVAASPVFSPDAISILQACKNLSDLFGWEIREVPNEDQSGFNMALINPARERAGADHTFTLGLGGFIITGAETSNRDVRNRVDVYLDGTGLLSNDEDTASVTKYGPRYMRITEGTDSQLNTTGEADDLTAAAIADLSEPTLKIGAKSHLFLAVQLNDLHHLPADDIHFDTYQETSVVMYRHKISESGHETTYRYSGKPSAAGRVYLLRRTNLSEIQ